MAVVIATTEGDIDGSRFRGLEIDPGTWSVMADVDGFDDPIVVEDFASQAAAEAGMRAVADDLASEGDTFPDAVFDNLTWLGVGKTALAGPRIEIGTDEINRADFKTDDPLEEAPGGAYSGVTGDGHLVFFLVSPTVDGASAMVALIAGESDGATVQVIADLLRLQTHVDLDGYADLNALDAEPAAPGPDVARLFAVTDAGKTSLRVRFATGAVQTIATEP